MVGVFIFMGLEGDRGTNKPERKIKMFTWNTKQDG